MSKNTTEEITQKVSFAIEAKGLTKHYQNGKVKALKNLNLEVKESEIFGFIGPNGAGKTTTIKLLLDLIRPTSGAAKIFGLDTVKSSVKIRRDIGFLPGEIFLPENITGIKCIQYFAGFKDRVDVKYLKLITKKLDLDINKKVGDYSKGNKQKLAIILAMMHKPKLLILDEPTSGLDPLNQQTFYDMIAEAKEWGTTTFFSTHILEEAEKICDRVGIIKNGKLLNIENIDDFKSKNIRNVFIETEEHIPLLQLRGSSIKKVERIKDGYHLITVGKNGDIIKKIAKFGIKDIKISEPSLEEIFMHYYKS
ncbi:MAG: ABC transporter ATP-binding protein [Patescibacteria group bacterium]|nr:ABC transporter ATP-binding protein [Patescibacteria group bacterium]